MPDWLVEMRDDGGVAHVCSYRGVEVTLVWARSGTLLDRLKGKVAGGNWRLFASGHPVGFRRIHGPAVDASAWYSNALEAVDRHLAGGAQRG